MSRPDTLYVSHFNGFWSGPDRWVKPCWRWTLRAGNGRIIGASTEAYVKRADCIANAARVLAVHADEFGNDVLFDRWPAPPVRVVIR